MSETKHAPEAFMEYFRTNYPGPDTIISKPDWHAPKIYRAAIMASAHDELLEVAKAALELFSAGHAIESFNWGGSALRAQDIRELNELPQWLSRVIAKAEGR